MLLCIQPTFKIVTVACLSSPPCSDCIRFYKSSLLTPAIRDRFFKRLQPKSCRTSKSKSSNALIRPKGLSFCRDVGWSNALSLGSTVAAGWPRISRTSTETPSLFSASPRFASCSEGFVRVHKLFGRTLRENVWPARTKQIGNAYSNQFEVPSLFFVLVTLAIVTRKADLAFVILEWVFVLSRIAHAVVHTTSNHVPTRGRLFVVGVTILLVMWIIFAIRILLSPSFDIP